MHKPSLQWIFSHQWRCSCKALTDLLVNWHLVVSCQTNQLLFYVCRRITYCICGRFLQFNCCSVVNPEPQMILECMLAGCTDGSINTFTSLRYHGMFTVVGSMDSTCQHRRIPLWACCFNTGAHVAANLLNWTYWCLNCLIALMQKEWDPTNNTGNDPNQIACN